MASTRCWRTARCSARSASRRAWPTPKCARPTCRAGDAFDAYDDALADGDFTSTGRSEPFPDSASGAFVHTSGDLLSVVILGPGAMASPALEGLDDVAPPGKTLVVLLLVEP